MSASVTDLDLARLEELAEKATPGPWALSKRGIEAGERGWDDVLTTGPVECMSHCYGGTSTVEITDADREFIAALRNAVPSLLAAARAVQRIREVRGCLGVLLRRPGREGVHRPVGRPAWGDEG